MDIKEYLSRRKKIVEKALPSFLPKGVRYASKLRDAAEYSLMTGGKRIRPIMAMAACEAVSGSYKEALPLAAAIEMIHTYTLIHDDLPAMDDDDVRRGKPTCHVKFGEDTAILAGDMLNTLAFEVIARHYGPKASPIIEELALDLGLVGVVGGQAADLASQGRRTSKAELDFIDARKTACLFVASAVCGGMAGGAASRVLKALRDHAMHLGLAFQITDDILDHVPGSLTGYPAVVGLKRSQAEAEEHIRKAVGSLPKDRGFERLRQIASYLTNRKE